MAEAPGETVELPDGYRVKTALVGIGHEPVQFGPPIFRAGDSRVHVFSGDRPAAALTVLAQLAQLHLGRLAVVRRADSRVQGRAGYAVGSHVAPPMCNWVRGAFVLVTRARPVFSSYRFGLVLRPLPLRYISSFALRSREISCSLQSLIPTPSTSRVCGARIFPAVIQR